MPQINLVSVPYTPSSPVLGNEQSAIFRGKNLKLRGVAPQQYYEVYSGSENLNENFTAVPITGTIAYNPSTRTVSGTGTAFLDELHLGQMLLANEEIFVVGALLTNTTFTNARPITTTASGAIASRLPVLFALNDKRGVQLRGNALHFDKGTILSVGQGTLYVNGAVLPGDSLTATRTAQVALYDASTMTYDVQTVGFEDVPAITNANITVVGSGGTKNMSAGYYSFRVAYSSTITSGYGNPTDVLLSGGTAGYQVTAANSTFDFDFSADTPPSKADAYIIYGTAFAGSSAVSQVNAIQGAWFQIGLPVPFTSLVGGHYIFDYVDADLSFISSFDNDFPPDAEFYGTLDRYPFLVSTNGAGVGSGDRSLTTSPGPYVSPIKAENFDAYPNSYKVPTEKGETIIGVVSAAGRIFVLTPNTLQAVTPTGLPAAPFTCRPFWKRGFQGTYNVIFSDDTLYGFTTAGVFRSIATGDEAAAASDFATNVEAQMADWHGGYVFVEQDLKNEEICFFYSGSRQNDEGYWETDIYPYSLRQRDWVPPVILSSPTRDMIVSGVASVNGHLEFIAGGRRFGTTNRHDTWRYDTGSNVAVPYYMAWNYMDNGVETTAKNIRKLRPKGKFTDATVQIYAVTPDTNVDVEDLSTGDNAAYEYALADSLVIRQYEIKKIRVRNAMMWTARIEGTWDGTGEKDTFQELVVDLEIAGQDR